MSHEPEPLRLPRQTVADLHQALGKLLGEPGWEPPPPGDRRDQLPDHILSLLARRIYLSTACEMAKACTMAIVRYPEHEKELLAWAGRLHRRCRLNNKYSGELCACECGHPRTTEDTTTA